MNEKTALLIVDAQNDFLPPSGSLAVRNGREIIPVIHKLLLDASKFDVIVATLDYHPPGHVSFASSHSRPPFTTIEVPKINSPGETVSQMLWPDHCVRDTAGCNIEATIHSQLVELGDKAHYIYKGANKEVDAYSGFADNQYTSFTPLSALLHTHFIKRVIIVGLATDYCVRATAIDARKFGFQTVVVKDAVRAVDASCEDSVLAELERWGCDISTVHA